jgi:hypothetical protein
MPENNKMVKRKAISYKEQSTNFRISFIGRLLAYLWSVEATLKLA